MNLVKKITSLILIIFIISSTIIPIAFAQETAGETGITPNDINNIRSEGFTIVPANPNTINPRKFIFEIRPGETSDDYVTIENLSNQEEKFLLYGADPTFSAQGTPAYKTRQSDSGAEGSWIKFDNPQITLKGREKRIEHFTISVPPDTELGDYRAGITIEKSKADINNPNITIATRVILHSEIKVTLDPQPVPKHDGTFASSITPEEPSWQIVYFWISLGLFIVSFLALIIVSYQERKKKKMITESKPTPTKKVTKKTTGKIKTSSKKSNTTKKSPRKPATRKKTTSRKK